MFNNINKKYNINETQPLVVGTSAGPDSMALLHHLKTTTNNPIICCHINHNVRPESKEEEEYLKNYCQKENIIFESMTINEYKENNFENEARKKRYSFYEETLNKHNSKYLFLAHHGDDLIETILMKISRGSSLEGYAGIKEVSKQNNYYIIRPFIEYTKENLINYNNKNNIKYYIDKSNEDTKYTRNRYRKLILPILKEENNNILNKEIFTKSVENVVLSFVEEGQYEAFIENEQLEIETTGELIEDIYIDDENKCHAADDGTMREVEDSCFDGMCAEYIEGFYYVPKAETAVIKGQEYSGPMLSAFGDYTKMELAQARYELADADRALKELGVRVDG